MLEDEGYLGTRAPSTETRESSQQPPAAPATKGPGKGRGRKKLQVAQNAEGGVKHEQDDDANPHETTAERKRRERKEAATAAAMAQVQAIKAKAKARAQESEQAAQSEGMDEDQDSHVPRSDMYEDDSDDQAFAQDDQRVDLEVTDNEKELEDESVMDEETLAKRQEKEYEAKRRAIWDLIAHRQIREVTTTFGVSLTDVTISIFYENLTNLVVLLRILGGQDCGQHYIDQIAELQEGGSVVSARVQKGCHAYGEA